MLVFVAATTAVGATLRGYVGRGAVRLGEGLIGQIPLARAVHRGTKQIVETAIDQIEIATGRSAGENSGSSSARLVGAIAATPAA